MEPQENIEEKPKIEENENKIIEEKQSIQDESKNETIDEQKLLNDIKEYSNKNLYIISKELEKQIPYILSYIQNSQKEIINKQEVIKYIKALIQNIEYNLEILLLYKSSNEKRKLNIYEILIEQYIYVDKKETEYFKILEETIILILGKLSYNKDIYRCILSHISNFLNKKNKNDCIEELNLNEYNYCNLLNLICLFYRSKNDEKPINYYFFNGDKNTNIIINEEKDCLEIKNDLYILFFVKLVDHEYLLKHFENDKTINSLLNLMQINYRDKLNNFNINIDYKNTSISANYEEKLNTINIPYNLFNPKEINNVLIKLTADNIIDIYIDGKDIKIPKNQTPNKNISIENIIFSGEIYGIISTIMIYFNKQKNQMANLIPSFLLDKQFKKKDDKLFNFAFNYKDGLDEESLLTPIIYAETRDKVNIKNIYDGSLGSERQNNNFIEEIYRFMTNNCVSLYIPTRMYIEKINGKRNIYLSDSNKNIDALFNINELCSNLCYSKNGGIRILKNILQDFSVDLNGINHLLPCIEIMTNYPELLTSDNLSKFMSIILYLFTNFKSMISGEENGNFFFLLSQFLEKIPEKRNSDLHAFIKTILITLQSFESEIGENNIFRLYIQDFFNNVCMNEKILFKFNHEERALIYQHIHQFLVNEEQINIDINIENIIKLLLRHEENKYTHFCCKKHSEYFTKKSEIMEPELVISIKPILNIIQLILNKYYKDLTLSNKQTIDLARQKTVLISQNKLRKLFEILTFDITPCLQAEILKLYFEFFKKNELLFECLNIDDFIILITLFVFKTSLFDIKEMAFNYLIEPINKKKDSKNYQEQLAKYVAYYYFPRKQTNENIKSYPKSINIDKYKYVYSDPIEKKKLMENYDIKHYNDIMTNLYEKSNDLFANKKVQGYFNVLLSIVSKCNSYFIVQFLILVKEQLNKKDSNNINHSQNIKNNPRLIPYLLDTCYHAYLFKNSLSQNFEFYPGFDFDNVEDDKIKGQIIDNIISISSNLLIDLFCLDVYKLDYLMTWCKYYYELEEKENKYKCVRKFIFDLIFKEIIKRINETLKQIPSKFTLNYRIYFINIIFEYLTFNRTSGFEMKGEIKNLDLLYQQLCPSFSISLFMEIQKAEKSKEMTKEKLQDDSIYLLHEKWDEYNIIKSLMDNLEILNIEENSKLNLEKKIFINYICDKENKFNNDLKTYFIKVNENEYFKTNKNNFFDCNKGMELAIIKYHYYTLVLNVITNYSQFKDVLNNLRYFIIVTIIASTTITLVNPKNAKGDKDSWPNESNYTRLQHLVKNLLYNTISFLRDKIEEIKRKCESYKANLDDANKKSNYENYISIKQYLINTILIIFKVLGNIFKHVKQKEQSKKKSSGFKNMLSKLKEIVSPDKQGIHLTGGYNFINHFISQCLVEPSVWETNDNDKIITTFLDDIPDYSLSSINEVGYINTNLCKQLETIYEKNIANNSKIAAYFYTDNDRYQRDLFPFVVYITRRSELICKIIPTYDNSCNFKIDYNYLCLKPYYFPIGSNDIFTDEKINAYSNDLIHQIRMFQIEQNFNSNDKIRQYRKIKKKLFSFNGIFSTRKYFYDRKKYICKYRLLDHMTEDYTRIFLTPIIDMDYYLPQFSKFELQNLFRSKNKDNLIQICKITDLSIKEKEKEKEKETEKDKKDENEIKEETKQDKKDENEIKDETPKETKEEKNESNNLNSLYLLRQSEYKNMDELNKDIVGSYSHYSSYRKYIIDKQGLKKSYHHLIENCCYVKTSFHIRGFFYINDREIGFYSYDKIPYKIFIKKCDRKKGGPANINPVNCTKEEEEKIDEIQKDYDIERKCCFGSIFSPQKNKYDYLHFSIPYDQIVFILKRRYYFKVCCIEVFTTDKKTYFFKLDEKKLGDILTKIKHHMNPKPEDINIENKKFYQDIGFINSQSAINNMNKKIYKKNYMNLKNIYDKWRTWDISTLHLLMVLNLYGNRTFNDMNQYPVFPWIFTEYKSETFPENFIDKIRPLDSPMGMLEISQEAKDRRKEYISHWNLGRSDDDDEEEGDKYDRYGSHYSTSLYVSYYLVRMFPFSSIRIELQGASFDDPNRLFNAIDTSFDCSSTQKSDLRELVPELFCCPEILLNNNDFNFGEIKDDKDKSSNSMKLVQEVVAPKWSKNDPYLFVKKHRELLESFEVSTNINKWINLIFGYLQKGKDANEIHNLFAEQSYEDYESIYDKLEKDDKEISCRMLEFGVTPNQIFKGEIPKRKTDVDKYIKNKLFYNTLLEMKKNKSSDLINKSRLNLEEIKYEFNSKFIPDKIYYFPKDNNHDNIKKNTSEIYLMNKDNLEIYLRKNDKIIVNKEGQIQKRKITVNEDGIGNEALEELAIKTLELKQKERIKLINLKYGLNNKSQPITYIKNGSILVKGGYYNGNIILQNLLKSKEAHNIIKESNNNIYIYPTEENSPIMNIIFDKNENFAICGNTNGTIYVFRININNKLNWTLYKTINDHNSPIVSIALHETLNIAITCSENGLCMLYTLPYFKLYNSFIIGKDDKDITDDDEILCPDIVLISDSPLPCFIFYVNDKKALYFYSINGKLLSKHVLNYELDKNSIKLYRDYQFVDYIVLYNKEKNQFEIRNMIEFELIGCSPVLSQFEFIDFVFSLDYEHILVFGRNNGKYKLYAIYDSDTKINWK